jgi:signal peptidase I
LNIAESLQCDSIEFAELSTQVLGLGKHLRFRASGISMQPIVRNGDILLIAPRAEDQTIKMGDVVLSTIDPGRVVVHRVIRRKTDGTGIRYLLQGDYATKADGWVAQADLLGRLVEIQRDGQTLQLERPIAKGLGWLFLLRSRYGFGRGKFCQMIIKVIKGMPMIGEYLN